MESNANFETDSSSKQIKPSDDKKFTSNLQRNNTVTKYNMTTRSSDPEQRNSVSINHPIKVISVKRKYNAINKINPKAKFVSCMTLNEIAKGQKNEKKQYYLDKSFLSNSISQNNFNLSTNISTSIDRINSEHKLQKLLSNKNVTKGHSQSATRLDLGPTYRYKDDINSKGKIGNGMPKNKKIKLEIMSTRNKLTNPETKFANTKDMENNKDIRHSQKDILKAKQSKNTKKRLTLPFKERNDRKNCYLGKEKFVQKPNQSGEMLKPNCNSTVAKLSNDISEEFYSQTQIMHEKSKKRNDSLNFRYLNATNFKDNEHPKSDYGQIEISDIFAKTKHLRLHGKEKCERKVTDKVVILKCPLLKEIDKIEKQISDVTKYNTGNRTIICHNRSGERNASYKSLETSDIDSDTIQTVKHAPGHTGQTYFNNRFSTPEYTDLCSSHHEHFDANKLLDDGNFPAFSRNCSDEDGLNVQDDLLNHSDTLNSTKVVNDLNRSTNADSSMMNGSSTLLNDENRKIKEKIPKQNLNVRNENRTCEHNMAWDILFTLMLILAVLTMHSLVQL